MKPLRAFVLLLGLVFFSNAMADLVVYDVDPKYRREVFSALQAVLQQEHAVGGVGSVAMLPTGQILIDTTPERHTQVASVLEAITEYQAESAPQVTLRYWAVLGSPGVSDDPNLPPILGDMLTELRRIHGPLGFRLIGNATLVTESGQEGRIGGSPLSVTQLAYVQGSTLNAELTINLEFLVPTATFQSNAAGNNAAPVNPFQTVRRQSQGVSLNTTMAQDEFLVVGESSIEQSGLGGDGLSGTIFFIVHWPTAD